MDVQCSACPRSWHRKCIGGAQLANVQNWICGECATILKAENAETRSEAMSQLSVDQLCMLLKHIIDRMRDYPGVSNKNLILSVFRQIIQIPCGSQIKKFLSKFTQ